MSVWEALYDSISYVPKDKQKEIYKIVCRDCKNNDDDEHLECCYCQCGSCFEERVNKSSKSN